jgi:hypothetical protein
VRQALPHAVLLAGAVALYVAASRIDVDTGGRIGPAVWPKTILVIMAILCAYEIVKRLLGGASERAKGLVEGLETPGEEGRAEHPRRLAGGVALVIAYVFGVQALGFFVATVLFLTLFPLVGGWRRPVLAASMAFAGSFALIVVFMRVAYISLPLGMGPFRELSIALIRLLGVT